jgi:hypothetical protein
MTGLLTGRLIDFEELRIRLDTLEDTRRMVEWELSTLQYRTERRVQRGRGKDRLLESYTGFLPVVIDALESEER